MNDSYNEGGVVSFPTRIRLTAAECLMSLEWLCIRRDYVHERCHKLGTADTTRPTDV